MAVWESRAIVLADYEDDATLKAMTDKAMGRCARRT